MTDNTHPTDNGSLPAPLVWLLLGPKKGDNQQVFALAEALGWPFESRNLRFHPYELLTNRLLRVTLAGLDRAHSDALEPPWPDLIITAGRRNEPVALWIKKQSGGRARIVHLGRPWAPLDAFDLIVSTPQYLLPRHPGVLMVNLPLHRINTERLVTAAKRWASKFKHLPAPRLAVMLGGNSGHFQFTEEKARRLGREVNSRMKTRGGSLLLTNSARTPPLAWQAFLAEIAVPATIYTCGQDDPDDNPYMGYLALADEIVVTGESMSMLAESSATGKPLHIFDLGEEGAGAWWLHRHNFRFKPLSHRLAMRWGPKRMRRDVGRIQNALVESGRANWLGKPSQKPVKFHSVNDAEVAAKRVRALFTS